jgi:hypothetical protein
LIPSDTPDTTARGGDQYRRRSNSSRNFSPPALL